MDELIVVTHSNWMFEELRDGQNVLPVRRSFGLDVPVFGDGTVWWMPQASAAHFVASGVNLMLESVSPDWILGVPEEFLKRKVAVCQVSDCKDLLSSGLRFVKLATGKLEGFPARVYKSGEVEQLVSSLGVPEDSWLQFSEVVDASQEFRFFVNGGSVVTGSAYLVDGVTYYDGAVAEPEMLVSAEQFLNVALGVMGFVGNCVVDVGWSEKLGFFILEANSAWASAWYGCDLNAVVECLVAANSRYPVQLDSSLMSVAHHKRPLQIMGA